MKLPIAATVTGTLAVAGIVAAVVAVRGGDAETPPQTVVAAAAAQQPTAPAPPSTRSSRQPERNTPLGDVVPSGLSVPGGELVFYAVPVEVPDKLPNVHFGVMAGVRGSGGLTGLVETNETKGSDRAPGFHGVTGAVTIGDEPVPVPTFGYYAGPAAKITGTVGGKEVQAHQAAWSQDPGIVLFWFDSGAEPTRLTAVDAAGKKLPTGNTVVTHG